MKRARDQDGALESQRIRDHWKVGAKGLWAHFIDGKERYCESNVGRAGGLAAEVSGALQLRSPFDGTPMCMVSMGEKADVDRAVAAAAAAHADGRWSGLPARQRARVLLKAASLLADNLGWLAEAESRQTGRCLREMRAQLGRLPEWLEHFAALAQAMEGQVPPFSDANHLNYVRRVPLGVCALITPWNHPLLIALKKIAPALAAGNSVVVKP